MNRCDLSIEFSHADREFQTGEGVRGQVHVVVNKDLRCRGLQLSCFWKTHGRGNTTRQNYYQQMLFQGNWQEGETYTYPFEFQPPLAPLTYHGRYLNIDHYVAVRADIPWAVDPRGEEEFMWRVGREAPKPANEEPVLDAGGGCGRRFGLLLAGLLGLLTVLLPALGMGIWFLLLALPAAVLAFLSWRSALAERKLGAVQWGTLGTAYPGETLPALLQVGPLGNVKIREITATLVGVESVTSGSGTDAKTHTHELHREHQIIASAPVTRRGTVLELQPQIRFPDIDAFTVNLPDNTITWSLTLAIRLVGWPDWVQRREVILVGRPRSTDHAPLSPQLQQLASPDLAGLTRQLIRMGNDSSLIDEVLANQGQQLIRYTLPVDRVLATVSDFTDPAYVNGRTLQGRLVESDIQITLQLPARYNPALDQLTIGDLWSGSAAALDWDPVQKRLTLLGI